MARDFLKPQGPEAAEERIHGGPGQPHIVVFENVTAVEPLLDCLDRMSQKRKSRSRRIQFPEPAAECGRIGYAMRIFQRWRRRFPATAVDTIPAQRLTACD